MAGPELVKRLSQPLWRPHWRQISSVSLPNSLITLNKQPKNTEHEGTAHVPG